MKISVLWIIIAVLLLAGCSYIPADESTDNQTSASTESLQISNKSDVVSSVSAEESYTEVAVYGEVVSIVSRSVWKYTKEGLRYESREYSVKAGDEILYPFGSGEIEIREEYGYLRVMTEQGDALLSMQGEEIIALGEFKFLRLYGEWMTAHREDGSCVLFDLRAGYPVEKKRFETSYYFNMTVNGVSQFSGSAGIMLIYPDGNATFSSMTNHEELQQNETRLNDTAKEFYEVLRQCSSEQYDALLEYLPLEAEKKLSAVEIPEDVHPTLLGGYELLAWILQYSHRLSETCYPTDWENACTVPGGTSDGMLHFSCGEYDFEIGIYLTAKSDGAFYISALGGMLV